MHFFTIWTTCRPWRIVHWLDNCDWWCDQSRVTYVDALYFYSIYKNCPKCKLWIKYTILKVHCIVVTFFATKSMCLLCKLSQFENAERIYGIYNILVYKIYKRHKIQYYKYIKLQKSINRLVLYTRIILILISL